MITEKLFILGFKTLPFQHSEKEFNPQIPYFLIWFPPLKSFRTFKYCDLWPYLLWPLDFQIQKRIISSETIWGYTVIWVIFTDIPVDHPITAPISAFAFSGNGFLIVLICIERFVMIIYPEKSKIWCSKRKTIIYICVASLTSLLMSVPDFFAYSWDENGKVQVNLCQKLLFLHQLTNNMATN